MNMKGVDDFYYVLLIALVIVAAFTVFAAIVPPAQQQPPSGVNETLGIVNFTGLGPVGFSADFQARSVGLGNMKVGETQKESLKQLPKIVVSTGLLTGMQKEYFTVNVPSYYMSINRGVEISFDVYDTNQYGNLIVKWNGQEFLNTRANKRPYTISLGQEFVTESNSLEIYCDGPGLLFWASTVYDIRNLNVNLLYGPSRLFAFELGQNELSSFNRGELSFYGFGNAGSLDVKVNGVSVWNELPSGTETIVFNFTTGPINLGNNIVSLTANEGLFTLDNAQLRLFLSTNEVVKSRGFSISQDQYKLLSTGARSGKIEFYVDSILRGGNMVLKLNSKPLNIPSTRTGWNEVSFGAADSRQGTNSIELSGSGYWDVSDVVIRLV
jgi:hypothetical protein